MSAACFSWCRYSAACRGAATSNARARPPDSAATFPVGEITPEAQRLLDVCRAALDAGIEAAQLGSMVGDISAAVKAVVEDAGLKEGQVVDLSAVPGLIRLREIESAPHYSLEELLAEAARLGPENRPPFVDLGILPSEWPQDDWSDIAPTDEEMGISRAGRTPA